MKIDSPVSHLVEVLNQINQSAKQYAPKLRTNEAATRASLIDPVLRFIGWDLSNPDMVDLERVNGNTRLDYGLLDPMGKVNIIVEVKALGVNLSDPRITTQLFSYAFTYGIQNIILTDGILWQHYLTVSPGNIIPEGIDISKDDIVTCAYFFVNKLDAFQCWTVPNAPVAVPAPVQTPVVPVAPPVAAPLPASTTPAFVPLSGLPTNLHGQKAPKSLRLPDGKVIPVRYWRDILVACAKFVLNTVPTMPVPMLDKSGLSVSLLSAVQPPSNIASTQVSYNGRTVYIYTNYDVNGCIANAKYILGFLPKNKNWQTVEVVF